MIILPIILVIAAICSTNLLLNVVNHNFTTEYDLFSWIKVVDFQVSWGIKIDALSTMMIFVINGICSSTFLFIRLYERG